MSDDAEVQLGPLRALHDRIRDAVVEACLRTDTESMAAVASDDEGDTIYAVDRVSEDVLGPVQPGKARCFEDQYISTGGQLYELMAGHDRFLADLRPLLDRLLARRGLALGICCHPYDICTELVARELGVVVTDAGGAPLEAPLAAEPDVAWVGYANAAIRAEVEPLLQGALRERGL